MEAQVSGRRSISGSHGVPQAENTSAFSRNVASFLDRIEYRRCETGEDVEDIYRLRYNSYLAAGMIRAEATPMVVDAYDELPNSYRFGVYYDGHLVSTLRLHHVSADQPSSPSATVFKDTLAPRLAAGQTFIDPSRFAADFEWSSTLRVLPYLTLRLAVVACKYFQPDYCLTAVKEEHTGFYHRIFRSELATEPRTYPGLTCPVALYESKCSENMDKTIERFPFFKSTAMEQRLLFDRPVTGLHAPLTVLPTAKYMKDAA